MTAKTRKMNCFVAILKVVAAYAVVSIHFGGILPHARLAVPIFMFLSFYYVKWGKQGGVQARLRRLALPFVFWSVVPFIVHSIYARKFDIISLLNQLTAGAPENRPLYFLLLMMAFSVVIASLANLPLWAEKCGLISCVAICLILQYTGVNDVIWSKLPRYHSILCGRAVALMPAALCGRLFSISRKPFLLKKELGWANISLAVYIVARWQNCDPCPIGYGYQGISILLGALGICSITIIIGERLDLPDSVKMILCPILSATSGIYYMHQFVGHVVAGYLLPAAFPALAVTPLVFSLCLVAVLILYKWKSTRWMVM